jgi:uncharacterized protein
LKILAVSDVVNGKLYSPFLKEVAGNVDVIVSCGDLPVYYLDYLVSNLSKPLLYVCGNHDHYNLPKKHHNRLSDHLERINNSGSYPGDEDGEIGGYNMDSRVQRIGSLLFAGLEGSKMYNKGVHQYTERQMARKAAKIAPPLFWNRVLHGKKLDVLITHAPPKGIHDGNDRAHEGFKTYLPLLKKYRPRLLLHGHTHIYDNTQSRTFQYYDTTVINCYNYQIIDLD